MFSRQSSTGKPVATFSRHLNASLRCHLEMQDFEPRHCHYHHERHNSTHPAYALRMSTRDLARFGLLYLREGRWRDTQLIPSAWVRESTRSYSETPSGGYGYMWWTERRPLGELGAYAAAGWGGHRMYVIPRAQLVIVHRADTYLNGEVADHEIRGLIEKILRARIGPPASQPRLMDMPEPRPVDEAPSLDEGRDGRPVRRVHAWANTRGRPAIGRPHRTPDPERPLLPASGLVQRIRRRRHASQGGIPSRRFGQGDPAADLATLGFVKITEHGGLKALRAAAYWLDLAVSSSPPYGASRVGSAGVGRLVRPQPAATSSNSECDLDSSARQRVSPCPI